VSRNGYDVFLFQERFPVTPEKIPLKINGKNKTMTLINEGEINFLKDPALTDIELEFPLPMTPGYPFAVYLGGFRPPQYYLHLAEQCMAGLKTTQLIVARSTPIGIPLFDTNIKVSVENIHPLEESADGMDVMMKISLKKYRDFGTKTMKVTPGNDSEVKVTKTRETSGAPNASAVKSSGRDTKLTVARQQTGSNNITNVGYSSGGRGHFGPGHSIPKNEVITVHRSGGGVHGGGGGKF
jgi:hypothetical protein